MSKPGKLWKNTMTKFWDLSGHVRGTDPSLFKSPGNICYTEILMSYVTLPFSSQVKKKLCQTQTQTYFSWRKQQMN